MNWDQFVDEALGPGPGQAPDQDPKKDKKSSQSSWDQFVEKHGQTAKPAFPETPEQKLGKSTSTWDWFVNEMAPRGQQALERMAPAVDPELMRKGFVDYTKPRPERITPGPGKRGFLLNVKTQGLEPPDIGSRGIDYRLATRAKMGYPEEMLTRESAQAASRQLSDPATRAAFGAIRAATGGAIGSDMPQAVDPFSQATEAAAHLGGFILSPAKAANILTKPLMRGTARLLGQRIGPGVMGQTFQYFLQRGTSLGLAGVLSDLGEWKRAPQTFGDYFVMGEIFGLAGLANVAKKPFVNEMIRQVGGRILLGLPTDPAAWSRENFGSTVFSELLNTFFLHHGEKPSEVFAGAIRHSFARRFIDNMQEGKPTKEQVAAAGGPAGWLYREIAKATEEVKSGPKEEGEGPLFAGAQERPAAGATETAGKTLEQYLAETRPAETPELQPQVGGGTIEDLISSRKEETREREVRATPLLEDAELDTIKPSELTGPGARKLAPFIRVQTKGPGGLERTVFLRDPSTMGDTLSGTIVGPDGKDLAPDSKPLLIDTAHVTRINPFRMDKRSGKLEPISRGTSRHIDEPYLEMAMSFGYTLETFKAIKVKHVGKHGAGNVYEFFVPRQDAEHPARVLPNVYAKNAYEARQRGIELLLGLKTPAEHRQVPVKERLSRERGDEMARASVEEGLAVFRGVRDRVKNEQTKALINEIEMLVNEGQLEAAAEVAVKLQRSYARKGDKPVTRDISEAIGKLRAGLDRPGAELTGRSELRHADLYTEPERPRRAEEPETPERRPATEGAEGPVGDVFEAEREAKAGPRLPEAGKVLAGPYGREYVVAVDAKQGLIETIDLDIAKGRPGTRRIGPLIEFMEGPRRPVSDPTEPELGVVRESMSKSPSRLNPSKVLYRTGDKGAEEVELQRALDEYQKIWGETGKPEDLTKSENFARATDPEKLRTLMNLAEAYDAFRKAHVAGTTGGSAGGAAPIKKITQELTDEDRAIRQKAERENRVDPGQTYIYNVYRKKLVPAEGADITRPLGPGEVRFVVEKADTPGGKRKFHLLGKGPDTELPQSVRSKAMRGSLLSRVRGSFKLDKVELMNKARERAQDRAYAGLPPEREALGARAEAAALKDRYAAEAAEGLRNDILEGRKAVTDLTKADIKLLQEQGMAEGLGLENVTPKAALRVRAERKPRAKKEKPAEAPPEIPQPLGRAPETVLELQREIVRINEGRVTHAQAADLMAFVKGVALFKGMEPDAYVKFKFAELSAEKLPETREGLEEMARRDGITDPDLIAKLVAGAPIAAVRFQSDGRAVLRAFQKSSLVGMVHELGHVFRRDLSKQELKIVERALNVDSKVGWTDEKEEAWARQFEIYAKSGRAPNEELGTIFARMKRWLLSIYRASKDSTIAGVRMNPEIRQVLDKMIGGKEIGPRHYRPYIKPRERVVGPEKEGRPAKGFEKHGPVIDGTNPPDGEIVATLGKHGKGASISVDILEELKRQQDMQPKLFKRLYQNPLYVFESHPFFKRFLYDVKVDADNNHAKFMSQVQKDIERWQKNVQDKRGFRLWVYSMAQQEGGVEALATMGIIDIPKLSAKELEVYNEVRLSLDQMFNRINQARELLGLEKIGKIKNYFTFLRKIKALEDLGHERVLDLDKVTLTAGLNRPIEPAFFKHRGKGASELETNFFSTYDYYMRRASKYVENAPVNANTKLLLEEITYADEKGKKHTFSLFKQAPILRDYLVAWENFSTGHKAESAISYISRFSPKARKIMEAMNRNLATGVLSMNIRSALIQPTSIRNAFIELGHKWLIEGARRSARDIFDKTPEAKKAEYLSRVLFGRVFDVHQAMIQEGPLKVTTKVGELKWKIAEAGMKPLQFLDYQMARMVWHGAYARATAPVAEGGMGLVGREAVIYADDVVTRTQASAAPRDIAPIQRTLEGRLMAMFQTFVINEWNFLSKHAFGVDNPDMTKGDRNARLLRLVISTAFINALFEDLLDMRSPFPTPEHAFVQALRQGKGVGAAGVEGAWEFLEQVPIAGGALRWSTDRRTAYPAFIQAYGDLLRLLGKARRSAVEGRLDLFKPEDLSAPLRLIGMPGVSQAEKTLRRLEQGGNIFESVLGQKIEALGPKSNYQAPPLKPADRAVVRKYGLDTKPLPKKKEPAKRTAAERTLLRKYGLD